MILILCCALHKLWGMKQINVDLQTKDRIIPFVLNLTCQFETLVKKKWQKFMISLSCRNDCSTFY